MNKKLAINIEIGSLIINNNKLFEVKSITYLEDNIIIYSNENSIKLNYYDEVELFIMPTNLYDRYPKLKEFQSVNFLEKYVNYVNSDKHDVQKSNKIGYLSNEFGKYVGILKLSIESTHLVQPSEKLGFINELDISYKDLESKFDELNNFFNSISTGG